MIKTIVDAPFGKKLRLERSEALSPQAELILEQLGLYPGSVLEKIHSAPLGDPITLRIGSQSFAIQKETCRHLFVEECL